MFQNNKYKRLVESIVTKKVNKLFNLDEGANGHSKGQGLERHQPINKTSLNLKSVRFFVTSPRFKLGTDALEGRCSIQLS